MQTAKERRKIKDKMARTELEMVHTDRCLLLPNRYIMLDRMPKNERVAEIGVAFGDYSKEILARCSPSCLYLIDAWATERYKEGLDKIKEEFSDQISSKKVVILQGLSTDVLKNFGKNTLDWAYIDTNHTYETTLQELILCGNIVAPDGRIAGHDFCTGNVIDAVPYGVVEAVSKFCKDFNWRFEYLTLESRGHFSFCLKRLKS